MTSKEGTRFDARQKDLEAAVVTGNAAVAFACAGDLLRRKTAFGVDVAKVDATLARLGKDAALAYVASIDAAAARTRLERGIEDAFEALIADDASEKELFEREAMDALAARDALESARVAVERLTGGAVAELDAKLAAIDAGLQKKERALIGVNARRRAELALLDADTRADAWWYSARVESDAVGEALAGRGAAPDLAQAKSAKDAKDLARLAKQGVSTPPRRVDGASLWLREIGAAGAERARWAERRADALGAADKKALDTDVE